MRLILGLVVFSALTRSLIKGEVYNVGDSAGWTSVLDVDYKHWAESKKFHVGDTISKFLTLVLYMICALSCTLCLSGVCRGSDP